MHMYHVTYPWRSAQIKVYILILTSYVGLRLGRMYISCEMVPAGYNNFKLHYVIENSKMR